MNGKGQEGFALVTVMMLAAMLMALLAAYFVLTQVELATTGATMDATRGFYAAEGGLNVRAEDIRQTFLGYNLPSGVSPDVSLGQIPCREGDTGSGDFRCEEYEFQDRAVYTYVEEEPDNPTAIVVPRGEAYQDLNAYEYGYSTFSTAAGSSERVEAILEMRFKSRLVPMFQFAAFYNKDLEILPGPAMLLEGPVHSNGDLYLNANTQLDIQGQITTAGDLYRGRKNADVCSSGAVSVIDPVDLTALPSCTGGRFQLTENDLTAWNGMIRENLDPVTVPGPEELDPVPGKLYWDNADIRIVLDLNGASPEVQVRDADGSPDVLTGAALAGCSVVSTSDTFYNNREGKTIRMLDVDVRGLLDCIDTEYLLGPGIELDEDSHGGLVFYLGVDGSDSSVVNAYGVRLLNGSKLASSHGGAPDIQGLTVVTDQAAYIQGDYNAQDKKPAAVLADSLNILSNDWDDADSSSSLSSRVASSTTVHAALLAGTDTTGGTEGSGGQDSGNYNGGLENYPRFHEKWSGKTLTYYGSFVSLNVPRHVDGAWHYGSPQYTAPNRDWHYDLDFNDPALLPPLTPRFVYLKQELFVREFEL